MFATKAFGMGIDIKDIKHVYHYAVSGNLNDYLQEVGRVAREKDMIGYAHMDYYDKDLNYTKRLFGMSAIKQYHIDAILRILNNVYQKNKKRNMLVTPQMFETVFPQDSNLENAVKTALLNIEKDMLAHYKIPVIITRPRSMFTRAYAVIDRCIEEKMLRSEYGKYFEKISEGRNKEAENRVFVTDVGAIYKVDLKQLWEEKFSKMTFQSFKYSYYADCEKILGEYAEYVYPRNKFEIEVIDGDTMEGIKEKLLNNINIVSEILSKFQKKQGEFTLIQFENELLEVYKDKILAKNIAKAYFKCIEADSGLDYRNNFYNKKQIGDVTRYKILNSNYRVIAESLVYKSGFLKEINNLKSSKIVKYKNNKKETIKPILKILNLLSLFNLVQYDMYGGEQPEIFIRINEPSRIKKIVDNSINYTNNIVLRASEKHKRDNEIFLKFIKDLHTDEERWDYIEKYFLGHDVLKGQEQEENYE